MDPLNILNSGVGIIGMATDAASKITDITEKVSDGKVRRDETRRDGDARREMDIRNQNYSILSGKWSILFDGINAACEASQTISGIIKEQRESKAQTASVYADIEDKHKLVDAEIERARGELEIAYKKAEAETKLQGDEDERNYQVQLKQHEENILSIQKEYEIKSKAQSDSHEVEMTKLELEKERLAIERLKAEKEGERIDAEIRQMDAAIEANKMPVQTIVNCINEFLRMFMTMMTWEMTPENQYKLTQQQEMLVRFIPQLQSLPMGGGVRE